MDNLIKEIVSQVNLDGECLQHRGLMQNRLKDTPIQSLLDMLNSQYSITYNIIYPTGIVFYIK